MTLVEIRCREHRVLLYEVTEPPADWTGTLSVPPCRRCASTAYDPGRHVARNRRDEVEPSNDPARPAGPWELVVRRVQWADLRPAVNRAQATGRVEQETV